jgi:hypothetical protein
VAIDFDNTIVAYDELFVSTARGLCLVGDDFAGGKRALRDTLRWRRDGELEWQRLQAEVYGELIGCAPAFPGAREFVVRALALGAEVAIVSHKTAFAEARPKGANLHAAARRWLESNGFIGNDIIAPGAVYFESSRRAKLNRIRALEANIAIDDLVEILTNSAFPAGVRRWLFEPGAPRGSLGGIEHFGSWQSMSEELEGLSGAVGVDCHG